MYLVVRTEGAAVSTTGMVPREGMEHARASTAVKAANKTRSTSRDDGRLQRVGASKSCSGLASC